MPQPIARGHALITGASSGIGAALAREFAARDQALILTARRVERLQALADELAPQVPCAVIAADLADPGAPARLQGEIAARGLFVDTLVNNAGYGVPGRYLSSDWRTHADFLQVMIGGVAELTHRFLPAMEAAGRGRVLNVASLAGLMPVNAGHTLYGASKAWLIRFSDALHAEMAPRGIQVCALCPGMTLSEFHDVNGMRSRVSRLPGILWMSSEQVAKIGVDALERGRGRAVPGAINQLLAGIAKYLPEGVARALVASRAADFRDAD